MKGLRASTVSTWADGVQVATRLAVEICFPLAQSDRRRPAGLVAASRIGETVADLAKRIGYSEREAYRRLRRLYSRIPARAGRTLFCVWRLWSLLD